MTRALLTLALVAACTHARPAPRSATSTAPAAPSVTQREPAPPLPDVPRADAPVTAWTLANGVRVVAAPMPGAWSVRVVVVLRGVGFATLGVPDGAARALGNAAAQSISRAGSSLPQGLGFAVERRTFEDATELTLAARPWDLGAALASVAAGLRAVSVDDLTAHVVEAPDGAPVDARTTPWETSRWLDTWDPRRAENAPVALPPRELFALLQRLITPARASVVIAGAFDLDAARAWTDTTLAPWRASPPLDARPRAWRLERGDTRVWHVEVAHAPLVGVRLRLPMPCPDARALAAARLACSALAWREGSSMHHALRTTSGLVYLARSTCLARGEVVHYELSADLPAERVTATVERALGVVVRLADDLRDPALFASSRRALLLQHHAQLRTPDGRAALLADAEASGDRPGAWERAWMLALRDLTPDEASRWARDGVRVGRVVVAAEGEAARLPAGDVLLRTAVAADQDAARLTADAPRR